MIKNIHQIINIYQINTSFYELAPITTSEGKILYIINVHRAKTGFNTFSTCNLPSYYLNDITYYLYKYDTIEHQSIWFDYLPKEITENQDFNLINVSFVLFAVLNSKIFAIIGGKGMFVIKRFLNHNFGLELYEKIANPNLDIVNILESRGISGNLNSQKDTYKNDQILIDTLSFDRIPTKLNLLLRQELIDSLFNFIDFGNSENIYIEIGNAFNLKWSLSFIEVHQLILKINEILNVKGGFSLSRFEKIKDNEPIIDELKLSLYDALMDDMMIRIPDNSNPYDFKFDNDFVHPSKLNLYYECDRYELFSKNARNSFFKTHDRKQLYKAGLKFLYENTNHIDKFEFKNVLLGIRVRGFQGNKKKTEATFIHHLTCEIKYLDTPIFLIDDKWYKVKGDFIESINNQCLAMIKSNYWTNNPLIIEWEPKKLDEGDYNLKYVKENKFIVLDKMLGQNIELCDLLYEDSNNIYLIHIKKGFDAKIRDLSNQIIISAKRLWNDINSGKLEFIDSVYLRFSQANPDIVTNLEFRNKFKEKNIIFVMAFCSGMTEGKTIQENIKQSKSNIAKFSLIQCVQEMKTKNYDLKIVEIK